MRPCSIVTYCLSALLMCSACFADATYELTFDSDWSELTHPGAYPSLAHFSPLIGGTHNGATSYWEVGGIASPAIEQVAETGGTNQLRNLVQSDIAAGTAGTVVSSGGIVAPGSRSFMLTVTDDHPLLSLVTMVAPSPDWFVGVDGLDFRTNGQWSDSVAIDLLTYDAGTDSGPNFTSSNADVTPHEPIVVLGSPLTGLPVLATFHFSLLTADALCDVDSNGTCSIEDLNDLLSVGPIADGVAVTYGLNDRYDLNGDHVIDLEDRDDWLTGAAVENGLSSAYFAADANLDGTVDGADFIIWGANRFTNNLAADGGDFNGDGTVDGIDFLVWNGSKFLSSDTAAVPEVGGLVWLWALLAMTVSRHRASR